MMLLFLYQTWPMSKSSTLTGCKTSTSANLVFVPLIYRNFTASEWKQTLNDEVQTRMPCRGFSPLVCGTGVAIFKLAPQFVPFVR